MKQLLSFLQKELPGSLQQLEQLVNMDSPSTGKALLDQFSRFAGSRFERIGGRVDYVPMERSGDHLRVRFEGTSSEKTILLLGHLDTVFPAGEAARRPFQIEGGKATGPGVFDMKAGIQLAWSAMHALTQTQAGIVPPVTVLLTSDEEIGSISSRALVEAEAGKARAVLVLEPALPGGALKTARKGIGRFTIRVIGRAAHAGIDPEKGINAIEEIARHVLQLQAMSSPGSGATVTVGLIHGGTRSNVVPADASIEVDLRISTAGEASRMEQTIRALQPYLPGARLEIGGAINRPPMERTAHTATLFALARSLGAELGLDIQEGSTGGASDGNFTSAIGIPTLDGLGAVGNGAHSLDEYVEVDSLPHRAALIAGLILQIH